MATHHYDTTDLDVVTDFERHVLHRDRFAHYTRHSHMLTVISAGDHVVDFGCGRGVQQEVFYHNRKPPGFYLGLDIRSQQIKKNQERCKTLAWAKFECVDLINGNYDYKKLEADKVISFEVAEHVGKQNVDTLLQHFRDCGHENATYYLSTPNYDEKVGAAGNHTYDSGDGRGVAVQEFEHKELQQHLEKYFTITEKWGTFASIKDYKPFMNDWQQKMYEGLKGYFDTNMLAILMAPFFPEQARNTLWVMKKK